MSQLISHLPLSDDESREELRRWGPWIGLTLVLLALCFAWFLLPLHEWMDALQAWFRGHGVWVLLGVGVMATIALGIIVARKTRQLFEASERRQP
jgi:cobalamin biosynthesis protein CobD/CbiB